MTGRKKLLGAIAGLGVLNMAAFVFVAVVLKGYAFDGYATDGRYFLGSHGIHTEVRRAVFVYSKWHGYFAVIGMVAALIASLVYRLSGPTDHH